MVMDHQHHQRILRLVGNYFLFRFIFKHSINHVIVQQTAAFFFSAVAFCERDEIELYYNHIQFIF
jgi:hypothetical protein